MDDNDDPASLLFREVRLHSPDVYSRILDVIRPHSVKSLIRVLRYHLARGVPDISIFNRRREAIPNFLLRFACAARRNFPVPGDGFGIQLTCRITKNDTQGTLDSKHMHVGETSENLFNVDKSLAYEIYIFSSQSQVLELATRRKYATVFVRGYTIEELFSQLDSSVLLERGGPLNKGRDRNGNLKYLQLFQFIIVPDPRGHVKIIYESSRDLDCLLRYLDADKIVAFSDIRQVFKMCGIVSHYLNMRRLVRLQTSVDRDSPQEHDLFTVVKYQCSTGTPLPLNRDGLAKNPERSPLEVLGFEAIKKNLVRFGTMGPTSYPVRTSVDKIFFGQQFNEGTGYKFALLPKTSNK